MPTVGESALPGFDVSSWNALAAPARTPPAVVARIGQAVHRALADPAVAARLRALGVEPQAGTAQALAGLLASETRRWAAVIERARIERQ